MSEIDHEAAKAFAEHATPDKDNPFGIVCRAYLDSQRQLVLRDQEITDQANKMQSEIGMLQLREKQLEKQLAAERARANNYAMEIRRLNNIMDGRDNAHAQGDKPCTPA